MNRQTSNSAALIEVAIVGAGFAGLGMGIQLKRAGITSFRIFERAHEIGGCWRDNVYPGLCCDIPSHLYSFSFEPNPNWSRKFAPGREIHAYLEHCKRKYGLEAHISYGAEITDAVYDENRGCWMLTLRSGESIAARFVVAAQGALAPPRIPDIPGLETFKGTVMHTARWQPGFDATGKRIAVLGNAASGVQVIPQLAQRAAHLTTFQRTANWIFPRGDREIPAWRRAMYRWIPGVLRLERFAIYLEHEARYFALKNPQGFMSRVVRYVARRYLEKEIADPKMRAKLWPDYTFGCKRMLITDDYYAALSRDNVSLVTDRIERIEPDGIVTSGGKHVVDAIVLATGFRVQDMLSFNIIGRSGRSMNDVWKVVPEAYLGVVATGFPNFFLPGGPNSAHGHTSFLIVLENHFKYIVQCIERARALHLKSLEVRPQAQAAYNEQLQAQLKNMVWAGSCRNWYQASGGRVFTQVPGFAWQYARRLKTPQWQDFLQQREEAAAASYGEGAFSGATPVPACARGSGGKGH
jgi:cation diffusion facilitator CzcD-associated flavoprotein CzcO